MFEALPNPITLLIKSSLLSKSAKPRVNKYPDDTTPGLHALGFRCTCSANHFYQVCLFAENN